VSAATSLGKFPLFALSTERCDSHVPPFRIWS
jgi:hypothetical protein